MPVRVALPRRVRRSPAYAGSPHSSCRRARAPRGYRPPGVARTRSKPRGTQVGTQAARGEQAVLATLSHFKVERVTNVSYTCTF